MVGIVKRESRCKGEERRGEWSEVEVRWSVRGRRLVLGL